MLRAISSNGLVLLSLAVLFGAAVCSPTYGASRGKKGIKKMENRLGVVVFQFDDGSVGHYTHAFRILEKRKLKGSFGVVTGALDMPGRLTKAQVREMHKAGHEIHDHTLRHESAFWGNPANQDKWPARIEESLDILRKLGIQTRGWNQPGGEGQGWSEELRRTLSKYYDYAAGRVALRGEQTHNMHWHLKDDPLSLGRGGIASWGYNGGKGDPAKEVENIKTKLADGIQQGLVVIPLWHVVKDEDKTAWGLEEICKLVRDNDLPTMVMADAVKATQNPRDYFAKDIEQMPNPAFVYDIDDNGRPDGYSNCGYAPPELRLPKGERAAAAEKGTATWLFGPEPGPTRFSLIARSADGASRALTATLTFTEVNSRYEYRTRQPLRCAPVTVDEQWQQCSFPVSVGEDVDRVKIELDVQPPGKVYLKSASWRLAK